MGRWGITRLGAYFEEIYKRGGGRGRGRVVYNYYQPRERRGQELLEKSSRLFSIHETFHQHIHFNVKHLKNWKKCVEKGLENIPKISWSEEKKKKIINSKIRRRGLTPFKEKISRAARWTFGKKKTLGATVYPAKSPLNIFHPWQLDVSPDAFPFF